MQRCRGIRFAIVRLGNLVQIGRRSHICLDGSARTCLAGGRAVSWMFGDSPIQGGRGAENVASRWPPSGPQWEFWRAYPECSGTEYKREGQTHILCARFLPSLRCSIVELGCAISARFESPISAEATHAVIRRGNR